MRQKLHQSLISHTTLDNIGGLVGTCHDLDPGFVYVAETFGFLWEIKKSIIINSDSLKFLHLLLRYMLSGTFLFRRQFTLGSCLAMSPPTNTASRYTHKFWTVIQFSMISEELVRFCTHVWMFFLKGALYLLQKNTKNLKNIYHQVKRFFFFIFKTINTSSAHQIN